jgi:hypothetical protein
MSVLAYGNAASVFLVEGFDSALDEIEDNRLALVNRAGRLWAAAVAARDSLSRWLVRLHGWLLVRSTVDASIN